MDLERLPSGKFATNSLIMSLAGLAYNILRFIGQPACSVIARLWLMTKEEKY